VLMLRAARRAGVAALFALSISACSGGGGDGSAPDEPPVVTEFSADRSSYFIGERAQLTARFQNGTARIEPGAIPVQNGQPVASIALPYGANELELVVTNGAGTARRALTVSVGYRERLRSIEVPFARGEHAAIRLHDGRVLFVGGEDDSRAFPDSLWVFDPATERFSDFGASLSTGRVGLTATLLQDGNILIAGGERALTGAPSAEIIRTADRTVVPTATSMHRARTFAAATLLPDGKVFISGGVGLAAGDTVEIFDPVSGEFALQPGRLTVSRYSHTTVAVDAQRIVVYGGFTSTQQVAPPEIYDLATGVSIPLPPAEANARGNHQARTMPDGSVWIIGGEDLDANPLTSVVRFDPATNFFAPFTSLATARSLFALDRLADGRLILVGGDTGQLGNSITNSTETLALDGTRRDGPAMAQVRWLHTATTLADGRVLIVGGLGEDRLPIRGAEIYE
jgi:hypothetical protein